MTDCPRLTLTPHNLFYAGMVGVSRHIKGARKAGQYGADNARVGWQINCDGACGELVLAKYRNVYWDGSLGNFGAADVGRIQVRTNPNEWGDLILHPKDANDDIFVLVLSHDAPMFHLRGWIKAGEGKHDKWWRDGTKNRPAFFVPQDALIGMSSLPEG